MNPQPSGTGTSMRVPQEVVPSETKTSVEASSDAISTSASSTTDFENLENEPKDVLIQRVHALVRQLKIRNSDCARLLEERQQLLPLREKCASQKEMILVLREELQVAQVQCESVKEAMEQMQRQQRDKEHNDRVATAKQAIGGGQSSSGNRSNAGRGPGSQASPCVLGSSAAEKRGTGRAPGGTVVSTTSGPQILYDSSDISSVGFSLAAKLPYDFLGGAGGQQQYLTSKDPVSRVRTGEQAEGIDDSSEDAQVRRTMEVAMDAAKLDAKLANQEEKEHAALMARIKALRDGHH